MKLNFKTKIKLFSIIFIVCLIGIVFSTFLIDKQIDSYIAEMKTNVDINIEIIDNNDNDVIVDKTGNDIKIYINSNKKESTTDTVVKTSYVKVVSETGLNIRKEPSIDSEKVGAINYGHSIKIIEDCGEWYKTDLGFIYKEHTIKI